MRIETAGRHTDLRSILRQICEQPDIVIRGLEVSHKEIASLAGLVLNGQQTILMGDDPGYSVALFGRSLLANLAQVRADAIVCDDARLQNLSQSETLLLAISESGETWKTIEALRRTKAAGIHNAAIVTARGTPVAREAEIVIELNLGSRFPVIRGNSEMAQIVALIRLAAEVAYLKRRNFTKDYVHILQELAHLPKCMEIILRNYQGHLGRLAHGHRDKRHWRILGDGFFSPATLLLALDASRIASFHVEGISAYTKNSSEATVHDGTLCIAFLPPSEAGPLYTAVLNDIERVQRFGAKVIAFCFGETGQNIEEVRLPKVSQWIAPLLHVFAAEILAYETAVAIQKQ